MELIIKRNVLLTDPYSRFYLDYEYDDNKLDYILEFRSRIRCIELWLLRSNNSNVINLVAKLLGDDNDNNITSLMICGSQMTNDILIRILNAISFNNKINILRLFDKIYDNFNFDSNKCFINKKTRKALHNCFLKLRNIHTFRISCYNFEYIFDILPMNIKNLTISSSLSHNHLIYILQNYRLTTLEITRAWLSLPNDYVIKAIKNNRSIIKFIWPAIKETPFYVDLLKEMSTRNENALAKSIDAATVLLLIRNRKYKKSECDLNLWIPKDIVVKIAKLVKDSYVDPIWSENKSNTISDLVVPGCVGLSATAMAYLIYYYVY